MQPLVFGFQVKEIIHCFIPGIDLPRQFIGKTKSFCPVKPVIGKQ
jgi:hypothetical protein